MSRKFTGRPPPLSTHPSGRYWGKPPALAPPGHKGKGKGGRIVLSAPEESICDTIDHSNLRGILRDLCYWQSHVTTVEELAGKVTSADWYPLLLGKLAESVIVISGAPNVGKSSLAVHLAKTLGLMRTKTTSRNFWLFARSERPYFSLWVYCTDSFWSEQEPSWSRMRQSVSSITSGEEFATGAAILEGHRVFAFPGYADLATTVVYLAATDKLLFERGTEAGSIRKHKLFLSNTLEQLQKLNKMIVLEGEKSQVYLVCQTLQVALLEDANLDASHLSADIELDGRWTFWAVGVYKQAEQDTADSRYWFWLAAIQFFWFQIFYNSGFTMCWPFWLYSIFSGTWQLSISLRQSQASKQDNHEVQRKFASNRHFVRGSVGTPEGNSSISGNHGIQCQAPSLGSKTLKAFSNSETNGFIDPRLLIWELDPWRHHHLDLRSWKHLAFQKPMDSLIRASYFEIWTLDGCLMSTLFAVWNLGFL